MVDDDRRRDLAVAAAAAARAGGPAQPGSGGDDRAIVRDRRRAARRRGIDDRATGRAAVGRQGRRDPDSDAAGLDRGRSGRRREAYRRVARLRRGDAGGAREQGRAVRDAGRQLDSRPRRQLRHVPAPNAPDGVALRGALRHRRDGCARRAPLRPPPEGRGRGSPGAARRRLDPRGGARHRRHRDHPDRARGRRRRRRRRTLRHDLRSRDVRVLHRAARTRAADAGGGRLALRRRRHDGGDRIVRVDGDRRFARQRDPADSDPPRRRPAAAAHYGRRDRRPARLRAGRPVRRPRGARSHVHGSSAPGSPNRTRRRMLARQRPPGPNRPSPRTSRPWCKSRCIRRALHPGGRRCASFKYRRYSRSARLVRRAHRSSRCDAGLAPRPASVDRWDQTDVRVRFPARPSSSLPVTLAARAGLAGRDRPLPVGGILASHVVRSCDGGALALARRRGALRATPSTACVTIGLPYPLPVPAPRWSRAAEHRLTALGYPPQQPDFVAGAAATEPQPHPAPLAAFTSASRAQQASASVGDGPPQHVLGSPGVMFASA